ncbi:MAG: DUF305 domain-containing protein [Pseudonocardia sp.]|nr:DUF305 domain-containing protein [Pseudonocardia sp.]
MNTILRARLLAGVAATGLVLTGCASGTDSSAGSATPGSSSSSAAPGERNEADVTFVQGMIPHHRQAVEMTELAAARSENPEVVDLAARIGGGQQPEIVQMIGMLEEWGAEVPAADGAMEGMQGMDYGGMSGMMTPEQMRGLAQASGSAFDRMFLLMMTEHHRGAIEMAQIELREGADPEALALAQEIIDTQQAEIAEMETLLEQV